jgi:hypothetical protein
MDTLESCKLNLAKKVLKEWFEKSKNNDEYMCIGDISFRSNRQSGIFLDYPICGNITYTDYDYVENNKKVYTNGNSWKRNWDEILGNYAEYVPTYDDCVDIYNSSPIAIIDIVCTHKGCPSIGIEICHKTPVSEEKINKLKEIGVHRLIEVDADWILNQTKIPSQIIYRSLI